MNSGEVIKQHLSKRPMTINELIEATSMSPSEVRNACSVLYFREGSVGCDTRGRHHLLGNTNGHGGLSNGEVVVRYLAGKDVRA